ncbi:MAG: Fis family transcriptional regulator [Gammaproteobacteria bacterium]|nr:MAG: Fis family transcriptional regulator [Gammaproteobacteria bacterium]
MATILAVDDSPSMRKMVSFTLKEAGHRVLTAENGEQGLELAKAEKADLVLTDINMPTMDGISLVKALRALPGYEHVPILVLTTESGANKKLEGKAAGATGWLVKPFNPEKLLEVVAKVLD